MAVITLTTDFGETDSYVAAMKGVILGIAPAVRIVDVTHGIAPQDIRQAAHVLDGVVRYFPPGTVHVVVVDPGVGSQRRPIALRTDSAHFVGPDNGVFSHVLAQRSAGHPVEVIHLDNRRYWLPAISNTFHGRDIFAPVGAHLASGVPIAAVGTRIQDPVTADIPRAQRLPDGSICGQIVHCDHFGNLISNIPGDWLAGSAWQYIIAGHTVLGPSGSYAAVAPGELVALVGSSGSLEIGVRDGSAAQRLDARVDEPIEAWPRDI